MNLRKIIPLFTLLLLITESVLAHTIAAQEPAKADEAKKAQEAAEKKREVEKKALALVNELIKEAPSLKLAENRIRVQATVADMLWKHDEKRARSLFKQAINDLSEILQTDQQVIETRSDSAVVSLIQSRTQLRQDILSMLARHDVNLAREFLRATRRPSQEAGPTIEGDEEFQWNMNLAARIAATDPGKALEIAEESLEKGLSHQLLNIIQQLKVKDSASADKLATAIMKKLRSVSLSKDPTASEFASSFLFVAMNHNDGDKSETLKPGVASGNKHAFDSKTLQELTEMVVAAALSNSPDGSHTSGGRGDNYDGPELIRQLQMIMPAAEKYAAASVPALRKKITEVENMLAPQARAYREYEALARSGDSEALAEAAAKAPPEMRGMLSMEAMTRAADEGDLEKARKILNELITNPDQHRYMLAQIERQVLRHAVGLGKLDEARQLLLRFPPEERASALTQFARTALGKGDKKLALQFLEEARGYIGGQATNFAELGALLQVARVYAGCELARSFDIIEPMVDQLNTLINAATVLDGFESVRYLKDGELIPQRQSILINMADQSMRELALLARGDFDRAKASADRFLRNEARIMARLHVARGVLCDTLPGIESEQSGMDYLVNPYDN